jgi:hypothetical protein
LSKLIWSELKVPSLLKVLADANLLLGDLASFVSLFPFESHGLGGLIPKDLFDLIGGRVVGGYHYESASINVTLARGLGLGVIKLRGQQITDFLI